MTTGKTKRILIAPLDWGLGHATRCIPIINTLRIHAVEVVIAASGRPAALLRKNFPDLQFIDLPGYDISYPKKGSMAFKMLLETPKIVQGIKREHRQLQQIIAAHQIDAVISDNRFGLYSEAVPCVFMTHQIHIQAPVMQSALYQLNKSYIERYQACWIPDFEGDENLGGQLSHGQLMPSNCQYIGPLSRFATSPPSSQQAQSYDLFAILSGPEPQRTKFEELVVNQATQLGIKTIIARGIPDSNERQNGENICMVDHMLTPAIRDTIAQAKFVLSRPGYSSLMDYACLGIPAILVPTPGQTEQEYLASHLMKNGVYYSQPQKELDLALALKEGAKYPGIQRTFDPQLLNQRICTLLEQLNP